MADVELDKLGTVVERTVSALGLELVHWALKGTGGKSAHLRVTIDRPEGITHDDCVAVDRQISDAIEAEDLIPFAYTLEVTSPGLGRALSGQPDFDRHRGEIVRIRTKEPIDERVSFKGRVERVTPKEVDLVSLDGREFTIPYSNIMAANTVQVPKAGRRGEASVESSDE